MSQIRVLLADDHPIIRSGIRLLLEQAPDITVVGETDRGSDVVGLVERLKPDVLLLDMEMPGKSGWLWRKNFSRLVRPCVCLF